MERWTAGAVLAWCVLGATSQPEEAEHHAKPRLIAGTVSAAPGGTIDVGVTFEIEPGWHLYWNGRNDAGFAPKIELALPEGWTAEAARWPAPVRQVLPGNLLDHIYERRVTLVIPVHVPASARAGSKADISAHVSWMECERLCMMAEGDVSLSVPIGSGAGAPSPDAALFDEARARMPVALPEHPEGLSLRWEGDVLHVESAGAGYLGFYPANEGVALVNPGADGESKTGALTLRFEWLEGRAAQAEDADSARVRGVLEVRRPDAKPVFYALDLARGQTAGTPQPGSGDAGIR